MSKLSHYDADGSPRMVDVGEKPVTGRTAKAHAFIELSSAVLAALPSNPKGDPLAVARVAGIMAAKRTADLIPLCHPLGLTHVDVEIAVEETGARIEASASTSAKTGVEMEALTAASVAALTIYDMTKALDKAATIREIYLVEKTGGKSGHYQRAE